MEKFAVIHALWIGECRPDTVSALIQRVIGKNFSHNALIYEKTGALWESTFDDDPAMCGVIEHKEPRDAMKGCVIRARKRIVLNVTEEQFERFLLREKGKPYAHGQNWATIFWWLGAWTKNGAKERNCSEFLAAALTLGGYKFPQNKDAVSPANTFSIVQPDLVDELVNSDWTFLP